MMERPVQRNQRSGACCCFEQGDRFIRATRFRLE
jgi:hypothetical protein